MKIITGKWYIWFIFSKKDHVKNHIFQLIGWKVVLYSYTLIK